MTLLAAGAEQDWPARTAPTALGATLRHAGPPHATRTFRRPNCARLVFALPLIGLLELER